MKLPPIERATCRILSNRVLEASLSTWKLWPSENSAPLCSQATEVGGKEEEGQFSENSTESEFTTVNESADSLG